MPPPPRPTVVAGSDAARSFLEGPSAPPAPAGDDKADRKKEKRKKRTPKGASRDSDPKPDKAKAQRERDAKKKARREAKRETKREAKQSEPDPPAPEAAVPSPFRGPAGVEGGYEEQLLALAELPSSRVARSAVKMLRVVTKSRSRGG
ncbi:hypothetical protein [Nocardiopsis chromatogenes]|uniref:hypothetical protein n=1 Tax=Nocardiopsis chromatogenes TaxID=280239 RepID=UPI00034D159D|nr:hypothetical protein [Nocardiopsis chromatogenes]